MTDATSTDVATAQTAAAAAQQVRSVLAELADPDSELQASAATRHRLEGAALALDQVTALRA